MKTLFKGFTVIDKSSEWNGKVVDILVVGQKIEKIAESLGNSDAKVIEGNSAFISVGWMDSFSFIGEPGLEHQETLETGLKSAAKGGFTKVLLTPNTSPCIQGKAEIEFLKSKSQSLPVAVLPMGALSQELKGQELAEMYEMYQAGAVAFGDGRNALQHTGLMKRALMYVKKMNGIVVNVANDDFLSEGGQMHEGIWSAKLGMKGVPNLAEEVMANRDIELAKYTKSKLHLAKISSGKTVELLRKAKSEGHGVSASVASYQLYLEDKDVAGYDSNYKVLPVLRSAEDRKALIEGLKDGSIDCICSNHEPREEEVKKKEFNLAESGIVNYETSFALAYKALVDEMKLEDIVALFTSGPRKVFGMEPQVIQEGAIADFTFFERKDWTFDKPVSFAKNTPFKGEKFSVKVKGTFCKGTLN